MKIKTCAVSLLTILTMTGCINIQVHGTPNGFAPKNVSKQAPVSSPRACANMDSQPPRNVTRQDKQLSWRSGRFTWTAQADEHCSFPNDLSGMWLTNGWVRNEYDPDHHRWWVTVSSASRQVCTSNAVVTAVWVGDPFGQRQATICRLRHLERLPHAPQS